MPTKTNFDEVQSYRESEWDEFAMLVKLHIRNYTIQQYGDAPTDEIAKSWNSSDCLRAISKYVRRFDSNPRGNVERFRDLAKIAHFACLAFNLLGRELYADDDRGFDNIIDKIWEGRA